MKKSKLAVAEAYNMALIDHVNVIGHRETFIHDGNLVVVMEYCEVTELTFVSSSIPTHLHRASLQHAGCVQ